LLLLLLLSIENSLPYQSCVNSSGWCCCYLRLQTQSSKWLHNLKYYKYAIALHRSKICSMDQTCAKRKRTRERERESCSSDKQTDKASGIRANEVKASPSPNETEEVVCAFFFSTVQGFEGSAEVRSWRKTYVRRDQTRRIGRVYALSL
jgi:hypothetical protein